MPEEVRDALADLQAASAKPRPVYEKRKRKQQKWTVIRRPAPPNMTVGVMPLVANIALSSSSIVHGDQLAEGDVGGHWVTIDGRHIFLNADDVHQVMFGAGIFRTQNQDNIDKIRAIFAQKPAQDFEAAIPELAKNYEGVQVDKVEQSVGVWQSSREASFLIEGQLHGKDDVSADAFASKLGESAPERQMAMVRFSADAKGEGAAYEFHNAPETENTINVLMKHGFDGQTLPLGTGRVILFDSDGSQRANVEAAGKELGLSYSTTPGHVRFIGEDEYKPVQNEYRTAHGQPTEIYHRHLAALQEAERTAERLYEVLKAHPAFKIRAGDAGIRWITIGGHHIPISTGGDEGPYDRSGPDTKSKEAYLFHGTVSSHIKDIMTNGLKQPPVPNWQSSKTGMVYAGTNAGVAQNFALLASGYMNINDPQGRLVRTSPPASGEPVELVLRVPKSEFNQWKADPYSNGQMHFGTVSPDHIVGVIPIPHADKPITVTRDYSGQLVLPHTSNIPAKMIPIKDYVASLPEQGDDFVTLYAAFIGPAEDIANFIGGTVEEAADGITWITINGNHIPLKAGGQQGYLDTTGKAGPPKGSAEWILFHGTSSDHIKDIMKNGLKQPANANWNESAKGAVYAANNSAAAAEFALLASGKDSIAPNAMFSPNRDATKGGEPVELVLRVPKSEFSQWKKDPKSYGSMHFGTITPDHIVGVIPVPYQQLPNNRTLGPQALAKPIPTYMHNYTKLVIPIKDYVASLKESDDDDDFVTLYAPYIGPSEDIARFMRGAAVDEGWVTIDGRHVLIGDEKYFDKMAGGADYHQAFTGSLTAAQSAAAQSIQQSFSYAYTGQGALPNDLNIASKELAAAGFNPEILAIAPLSRINNNAAAADKLNAQAFYNEDHQSLTINPTAPDAVIVHEIGHHLDYAWNQYEQINRLTQGLKVNPDSVNGARENAIREYSSIKKAKAEGISNYALTLPHEWIAEGVRQYSASPAARVALETQFPATYTYVHGIMTGDFE